jgi:hypothetical protein
MQPLELRFESTNLLLHCRLRDNCPLRRSPWWCVVPKVMDKEMDPNVDPVAVEPNQLSIIGQKEFISADAHLIEGLEIKHAN